MKKQTKQQKYRGDIFRYPDNENGVWWGRYPELQYGAPKPPRCKLISDKDLSRKPKKSNGRWRTVKTTEAEQLKILNDLWNANESRMIEKHQHRRINVQGDKNSERLTLLALAQAYTADALPQKSKSVQKDYSRYIQYWISQFGNKNLCEITPGQIKRCRDKLSKEVITRSGNGKGRVRSPATCNRYVMCLSSMFSFAKQETAPGSDNEWMSTSEANPCSSVKMLKEPDGRVRFLSKDELNRYLDACEKISPALHTASMIALTTGGRRMEVWDLKRADIKLGDKPMVTFRETKNGEVRSVKLVAEAVELFQKLPRRLDTLQVFPGKENPHQNYDFRYPFQKALEMAQISDFSWHDLRHTAASYLKMTGVDDRTIMEIMGWKSWSMLKRYTHLTVEHIGDAQDRLSQVYG